MTMPSTETALARITDRIAEGQIGKAALAAGNLARSTPEAAPAVEEMVRRLLREGRVADAGRLANALGKAGCERKELFILLAEIDYHSGNYLESIANYGQAYRLSPEEHHFLANIASIYVRLNDLERCEKIHERLIALRPDLHSFYVSSGLAFVAGKHYGKSLKLFEMAKIISPYTSDIHFNIANAYSADGRIGHAKEQYRAVLSFDPLNFDAHDRLGDLLAGEGDWPAARFHYEQAARRQPDSVNAQGKLLNMLEWSDTRKTMAPFPGEVRRDSWLKTGFSAGMETLLSRVCATLRAAPTDGAAYREAARSLLFLLSAFNTSALAAVCHAERLLKDPAAVEAFRAYCRTTDNAMAAFVSAVSDRARGNDAAALAQFERAVALGADDAFLLYHMACSAAAVGGAEAGAAVMQRAVFSGRHLFRGGMWLSGRRTHEPADFRLQPADHYLAQAEALFREGWRVLRTANRVDQFHDKVPEPFLRALALAYVVLGLRPDDRKAYVIVRAILDACGKTRVAFALLVGDAIGHQAMNSEFPLRELDVSGEGDSCLVVSLSKEVVANTFLNEIIRRSHNLVVDTALYFLVDEVVPDDQKRDIVGVAKRSNLFAQTRTRHVFTAQERDQGYGYLESFGFDRRTDWFACFYARDAGFKPGQFHRNVDFDSYRSAIGLVIGRGGWVVRIGSQPEHPCDFEHPRFIDYPFKGRSAFLDIFLVAHCRFLMGTNSGICDVGLMFDTPFLVTNLSPPYWAPYGPRSMFIPKRLRAPDGHELSMREIQEQIAADGRARSNLMSDRFFAESGYRYVENAPEDIADACGEMIDRLDSDFYAYGAATPLMKRYFAIQKNFSEMAEGRCPIALSYLRRHPDYVA